MIILGMDQAPSGIGFAYGEPGAAPSWDWVALPDYGDNTARLGAAARDWLKAFIRSAGIERVYFEQVFVRRYGLHLPTLYKQFAVIAGLEMACEQLGLQDNCYQVMVADWRAEFYAGRRPPKNVDDQSAVWKEMATTECARRGWFIKNHNAAEACGIWFYGCLCSDRAFRHRAKVDKRRAELKGEIAAFRGQA